MDLEERIIKDMQKTGFPLEIAAGTLFSEKGWKVSHQVLFYDEDERKSRKIDFLAHRAVAKSFRSFKGLLYDIVVECKKSDKPWIFYTPQSPSLREERNFSTLLYLKILSKPKMSPKQITSMLAHNHYIAKEPTDRIAQASYIAFISEEGKDQIFTAVNQVPKALRYFMHVGESTIGFDVIRNALVVYYPVVVFDGKMYECILEEGKPQLKEANYVKYHTSFFGVTRESDNEKASEGFLIDFVTKDFLPTYIEWLNEEIRLLE